jgi:low temperature requirement protein LtrA
MADTESDEKRVTWAELFFDLVFVFAVTELSELLHHDHSLAGVARAVVVFVPLWWAWVGTSIHANTHDVDNPLDRIGIFAVGLCGLFMALAVPLAYGNRGLLYGASYLALRILLAALVFRGPRMSLNAFSVGLVVTGPLVLAGGLAGGGWRVGFWALAGLVDLSTPALVRRRLARIRFDAAHLPERFGLFVIIALGESIIAVGLNAAKADPLGLMVLGGVAAAFAFTCSLWWVYFAFAASAVRHAIAIAKVQTDIIRQVLAYGHLCLIGSIIAVAVGLAEVVAHPSSRLAPSVAALLVGGCALYLATFGYTRWRMFGAVSWTRLAAAAVCMAFLPAASRVPGLAALLILTAVVVGLNVVEAMILRRKAARDQLAAATEATGSASIESAAAGAGGLENAGE